MTELNTQPSVFPEIGYCFFPDVFNQEEARALRDTLDVATRAGFGALPSYYGEPHTTDVTWLEACINPGLLDCVEDLLGPNLILFYSSMFIKPAHDDQTVCWHQDNTYWASVHGTDVVTVWGYSG